MYPLNAVFVNLGDAESAVVEQEFARLGGTVHERYPTAASALERLRPTADTRRLFIVGVPDAAALSVIRLLNDTCPGEPVVALSPSADDAGFLRAAMRVGASQVAALPVNGDDFRAALERLARQFGLAWQTARVVAVVGVTEGCGVTTIALNLASEAAQVGGIPTILAELGRIGRLAVLLNVKPEHTTQDLFSAPLDLGTLGHALTPVRERLNILAGPYQNLSTANPPAVELIRLIELFRRMADFVVLDLPYTFDDDYFAVLGKADDILLVTEQTIPSLHSLLLMRTALADRKIVGVQHLIVNQTGSPNPGVSLAELEQLSGLTLTTVREDVNGLAAAADKGIPLRDHAPNSPFLGDIDRLLNELLHNPACPSRRNRGSSWLKTLRELFSSSR